MELTSTGFSLLEALAAQIQTLMDAQQRLLYDVSHELLTLSRLEADGKQVRIEFAGLEHVACKRGGEFIHRAVENVLCNAVQHTGRDTAVIVTAKFDDTRHQLHLVIEDQRPSMLEEELTAIFEPFFRGGDRS